MLLHNCAFILSANFSLVQQLEVHRAYDDHVPVSTLELILGFNL